MELLIRVVVAVVLVAVSVLTLVDLLNRPQVQAGLVAVGVLLGLLWWMWTQLPEWFREWVRRMLKRKEEDRER